MRLRDIATSNLKRRRGRTIFLVASMVIATALMLSIGTVTQAMQANVKSKLREFGANVVVMPQAVDMVLSYGGTTVAGLTSSVEDLTEEDATLIATIRRKDALRGISPKLVAAADIEGQHVMIVGVRFRDELRLKPWWHIDGANPSLSRDIVLGSIAAERLQKSIGDSIELGGRDFRVVGILEKQYSQEDSIVFADLREVGLAFDKPGKVSLIEVSTWCAACPIEVVVDQISDKLPQARVWAVRQLVEAELAQVNLATTFSIVLTVAILLVGSIIMLTVMTATVAERTQEIGILRALGFRRSHIMKLFLLEGAIISLAGGFGGIVLGTVAAWVLSGPLVGLRVSVVFHPLLAAAAIALALTMGTVPTIFPARKAARLDPTTALRSI